MRTGVFLRQSDNVTHIETCIRERVHVFVWEGAAPGLSFQGADR